MKAEAVISSSNASVASNNRQLQGFYQPKLSFSHEIRSPW